ncbi:MAG: AAA family ATPase, partial [Maribacter sp.]|nr:AAA family ATPase [Maribacter sp.]
MAKTKTSFFCQNCGTQYAKWVGQCSACKAWNTVVEEVIQKEEKKGWKTPSNTLKKIAKPLRVNEISTDKELRLSTYDLEFNRVLGGGLVPGSLVLLGGEPGVGKSTLLLQIALKLPYKTLYVSGEESAQQISLRGHRLDLALEKIKLLTENNLERILSVASAERPEVIVIDSIQTVYTELLQSAPGSVAQVRESAAQLVRYAKQTNTTVLLAGHVTKDGALAGPRVLEHMVDTVLYFEGDTSSRYRVIRSVKNRYGAVN